MKILPSPAPTFRPAALLAGAALLVAGLLLAPAPAAAQPADVTIGLPAPLASGAAASYRHAARFPDDSRVVPPGAPDPVRAKRTPAPHSLRAGEDGPVITVWSREVSFEHPEPVDLYATLESAGPGQGRPVVADVTGQVINAADEPVGLVTYRDDGRDADRRAGDGIYSARFTFPADYRPALAESFGVRVRALTADGQRAGVVGGFLYSDPDARLTGDFRDSVRDGNLVIEAEVVVEEAGRFHLAATVAASNGEPLGWAQAAAELEPGTHWVELSFYGLIFQERGAAGPYRLASVALSTTTAMPNALNDLLEDAHRTRAYPLARFTDRPFGNPGLLQAAERLEASAGAAGGSDRN